MSILSMLREKHKVELATAIPAIPATHAQELTGTVARIATVAVASPKEAETDDGNSSKNSKNSSSKPCERKTVNCSWLDSIPEHDSLIVGEVLDVCRRDPAATDDDRRLCTQCSNLRGAVCSVARPGGLVSAIRGYQPALVDILQRCAGYSPNASDTDQSAGRERWPVPIQEGVD